MTRQMGLHIYPEGVQDNPDYVEIGVENLAWTFRQKIVSSRGVQTVHREDRDGVDEGRRRVGISSLHFQNLQ